MKMKDNKLLGWGVGLFVLCVIFYVLFYQPAPTAVKATNRAVKTAVNAVTEHKKEIEQHKIKTTTRTVKIREYVKEDVKKLPPDALVAAVLAELGDFRRAAGDQAP
jgi:type II secretory pathway component PulM